MMMMTTELVVVVVLGHESVFFCWLLVYVPDKKSEILGVRYNEVCTFNVLIKLFDLRIGRR
jgi:hypothetical protein